MSDVKEQLAQIERQILHHSWTVSLFKLISEIKDKVREMEFLPLNTIFLVNFYSN